MKAKGIDHMEKREQIKRIMNDYAEQQTNRAGGGAFGREEPTRLQKTLDQYAEEIEQLEYTELLDSLKWEPNKNSQLTKIPMNTEQGSSIDFEKMARECADGRGTFDDAEIRLIADGLRMWHHQALKTATELADDISKKRLSQYAEEIERTLRSRILRS